MPSNRITVFSKPWKCGIDELGETLSAFQVDGLELPVRDGYPVNPGNARVELPQAAKALGARGLVVESVAGPISEEMIRACGEAGIPIIRVCEGIDMKIGYRASVDAIKRKYERVLPILETTGVKIGLQNHCDFFVGSALGIMGVIGDFDPDLVGAVLDLAHCGLDGEPEEMAIDIAWSHLCMVNLKNAYRVHTNGPESEEVTWRVEWTTGPRGFVSWRKTVDILTKRGYQGPFCLTAEYSNPTDKGDLSAAEPEQQKELERRLDIDVSFLKSLLR